MKEHNAGPRTARVTCFENVQVHTSRVAIWRERMPAVEARYGGFREDDLYPDARRSIAALEASGYRVAVAANQPAVRADEPVGVLSSRHETRAPLDHT